MSVDVKPVRSKSEWADFLELPGLIYSRGELSELLPPGVVNRKFSRRHNPFLEHMEWAAFSARRADGGILGRIVASFDHLCPHEAWGFFGFFECVDDPEVAGALMGAARAWLLKRGKSRLLGPISLSVSDNLGCLAEGFGEPNPFYLPYNPAYYNKLFINSGLAGFKDLYAYSWKSSAGLSSRLLRIGERLQRSAEISIRSLRYEQIQQEAAYFREIYNEAMGSNWGHVPLTNAEALHILAGHRRMIPPDYFLWAEAANKPVGLCMALPDFQARSMRVMLLAVRPDRSHLGLSALLITNLLRICRRDDINTGELSFVQEGNSVVNKLITNDAGGVMSKRFRLYSRDLY